MSKSELREREIVSVALIFLCYLILACGFCISYLRCLSFDFSFFKRYTTT